MNDPLKQIDGQELFMAVAKLCEGAPYEVVRSVGVSLILNAIRQQVALRKDAEAGLTEIFNRAMNLLDAHYDRVTGHRRGIFPHTQTIQMPHHIHKSGMPES